MANKKVEEMEVEVVEAEVIEKDQMPAEPEKKGFLQKLRDKKKLAAIAETTYQSELATKYFNGEINTWQYNTTKVGHGLKKNGKKLAVIATTVGGALLLAAKAGGDSDVSSVREINESTDEMSE